MDKALEQTRRSFIKRAATATMAGVSALAGTRALAAESAANDRAASVDDIQWDEEFDVVIMGAGVAGESCAITLATEGGDESILLAEKGDGPSGNSPYALGVAIWCEETDRFEQYFKDMQSPYNMAPDDVMRAYAEGVAENKDWLLSIGANDDGSMWITECGAPTADGVGGEYPELGGGDTIGWLGVGMGENAPEGAPHVCAWMEEQIKTVYADKVDYRTNTPVTAVIQDPATKEVLGVIIDQGGAEVYVKANKGVVMCCGGFERNPEMLQNYVGMGCAVPGAGFMNTGDGIDICHRLGADFWHMENVAGFWMFGRNNDDTASTCKVLDKNPSPKQFGITVAINGRRFYMDWDGYMTNPGYELNSDLKMHEGFRHGHTQFGGEWPHLPMPEKAWFVFDADGLAAGAMGTNIAGQAYEGDPADNGDAYRADSIEELAGLIDVPADELAATVEQWNRYCDEGKDEAFYRPAEYMTPVRTAPFYAQLTRPHFLNTDGGPRRSAAGEILDVDGDPIPNLYSAGEFGSVWGNYYQGAGNIAECMVFGRICARSIIAK